MSEKPFVSVVMPIYNVEKHLEQAIQSVLRQTLQDFELILVDDCSPDRCPEICDKYAEIYEKVSVIHHEKNQGLSGARNTGLEHAKGKYIWFMDSDDYVDIDLFEQVYESVQQNLAEVIVFGLIEEYYDQTDTLHHSKTVCPKKMLLKRSEDVRNVIVDLEMQTLYGYAWNKFYSLEYLRKLGIRYQKITLIEDILFNVEYCMDIEKMNVLGITPYHYNKRMDNSLTAKFVPAYYELHRKRIQMIYDQYVYWDMCTSQVKSKLAILYVRYIFSALQRNCDKRSRMNCGQRKNWVKELFQDELLNCLLPYAEPESTVLKIMSDALKKKNTCFCLLLGRVIFITKDKFPMLFAKVKHNR